MSPDRAPDRPQGHEVWHEEEEEEEEEGLLKANAVN